MITLYGDKLSVREFMAVVIMWLCYGTYALGIFAVAWWWLHNTPSDPLRDMRADLRASRAAAQAQVSPLPGPAGGPEAPRTALE